MDKESIFGLTESDTKETSLTGNLPERVYSSTKTENNTKVISSTAVKKAMEPCITRTVDMTPVDGMTTTSWDKNRTQELVLVTRLALRRIPESFKNMNNLIHYIYSVC